LIHGSLQPRGVIVGRDGRSRIARLGGASVDCVALPDAAPADAAYLAPEQWGVDVVDERTDVFAVGAILWELIAGRRLFTGSREAILFKMIRGEVPAPGGLPRAATDLVALCRRALEPRRAERLGSARAFASEVSRLGKGFAIPMSDAVVADYLDLRLSDELHAHDAGVRMAECSATRRPGGAPRATAASATTKMAFDHEDRTVAIEARAYSQLAADLFLGPSVAQSPALPLADDVSLAPRDRPATPASALLVTKVSEGMRAVPAECAPEIGSHTVRMVAPTASLPHVVVSTQPAPEASSLDAWFQDEAVRSVAAAGGAHEETSELLCRLAASPAETAAPPSRPTRVRSRVALAILSATTIAALVISGIIPTAWFGNLVEAAKRARTPGLQPEVVATPRPTEPSVDVPALASADPPPSSTGLAAMSPGASATATPLLPNRPVRGPWRPRPVKHGSTVASAMPLASGSPPTATPEAAPHPDRGSEATEDAASRVSSAAREP